MFTDSKGQTLLEVLIAFSVSILVVSSIVVGVTTSLSNTQYAKNQNLANSYAQEGMAIVRQIRDSGWVSSFSKLYDIHDITVPNSMYCIGDNSTITYNTGATGCGQNVVGIFSRQVIFDHDIETAGCTNGSKATVTVSWADNKCPVGNSLCHKVELVSCFSNIDTKPTP